MATPRPEKTQKQLIPVPKSYSYQRRRKCIIPFEIIQNSDVVWLGTYSNETLPNAARNLLKQITFTDNAVECIEYITSSFILQRSIIVIISDKFAKNQKIIAPLLDLAKIQIVYIVLGSLQQESIDWFFDDRRVEPIFHDTLTVLYDLIHNDAENSIHLDKQLHNDQEATKNHGKNIDQIGTMNNDQKMVGFEPKPSSPFITKNNIPSKQTPPSPSQTDRNMTSKKIPPSPSHTDRNITSKKIPPSPSQTDRNITSKKIPPSPSQTDRNITSKKIPPSPSQTDRNITSKKIPPSPSQTEKNVGHEQITMAKKIEEPTEYYKGFVTVGYQHFPRSVPSIGAHATYGEVTATPERFPGREPFIRDNDWHYGRGPFVYHWHPPGPSFRNVRRFRY